MLKTRIVMSLLIFHPVLILVLRLVSFINLTIPHMVLVYERIALGLHTLVTSHVLIVVIIPRICTVFMLKGLILALS
jgi:hypothetical protein